MNKINFSCKWDKLNDPEFTTIRSWNPQKESYYMQLVGSEFQVWKASPSFPFRREYVLFHAWLREMQIVDPKTIDSSLLRNDVTIGGEIDTSWIIKILKMNKVILLKFSKCPHSNRMLLEWFNEKN